jgi:putative RNA 2'-phosphotransferase
VVARGSGLVTVRPERLSRLVSRALRHEPWLYELELDVEGWVQVTDLLDAIHGEGPEWSGVDQAELERMIATSAKRRHEVLDGRIRALYGHSVPGKIHRAEAVPPPMLFHGTSPQAWAAIQRVGLQPMNRQYVHLSVDRATADQVGRRKSSHPIMLIVDAGLAHEAGTSFWPGNEVVWLAEQVPAEFISIHRNAAAQHQPPTDTA